ncbi:MAG: HAMP domain-containing protein, partial [Desulfovibrionaceae bacterium]
MKLRWKMLALLAFLALAPLLLLRFAASHSSQSLMDDMISRIHSTLMTRAEDDLLRRLRDHVRIVNRDRQIIQLSNAAGVKHLSWMLEHPSERPEPQGIPIMLAQEKYCRLARDGTCTPVEVDWTSLRLERSDGGPVASGPDADALAAMVPAWYALERDNPDLVLWHLVRLESGLQGSWPAYAPPVPGATHADWSAGSRDDSARSSGGMGHGMGRGRGMMSQHAKGAEAHSWYERARESGEPSFWVGPFVDPVTRKPALMQVWRITDKQGRFLGATGSMIPMRSLLRGELDRSGMSGNMTSLLFAVNTEEDRQTLSILADEGATLTSGRGWREHMEDDPDQDLPEGAALIASAVAKGQSGTLRMPYRGRDHLWVYSPFRSPFRVSGFGLALVVPMEDVAGVARETESYVRQRINSQFVFLGYVVVAVALAALAAALVLSGMITRRISTLAGAFRRVAQGDFSVRVSPRGKDEIGDLARTFNDMIPDLEDQVGLREAIGIAREVQASLLPKSPPAFPGLEMAGRSRYSDETGGDYYDYIPFGEDGRELAVLVGDVSGHGVQAALLMTTGRALLRQSAACGGSPGAMVENANRLLSQDLAASGRFMTLMLCAFTPGSDTVR